MLQIKVVLVDTTGKIKPDTMAAAAEALNVQVTRDLPQFWNVNAAVSYRPDPHSIPQGMWPVQLVASLPPGEGGFHLTQHNQPYAKVIATPGSDDWTIDASHETVEMLVDPYGNRLQTSTAIGVSGHRVKDGVGKFEYLVEACDPCEANKYAYQIDGVMVSDFITPSFYDLASPPNARYSFTGAIKSPRELLPGGYISWVDPKTNDMQQILWVDPNKPPQTNNLGPAPKGMSLREFVESKTYQEVRDKRESAGKAVIATRKKFRADLEAVARIRAKHYV
jgi:hypothetical protein